jgi:hypothetical protein
MRVVSDGVGLKVEVDGPHDGSPVFRVMREAAARWQAEGTTADAVAAQLAAKPFGPEPRERRARS